MSPGELAAAASPRAPGVRAIVIYKLVKAVAELLLGTTILLLALSGYVERAHDLAMALRDHLVHHWSIKLAELMMRSLTTTRLWWVVAALYGDSVVSAIEGWGLARGYRWAPWLVVAATSLLLPVEIIEAAHHTTMGRVLLFFINAGIVLYLLKRAMQEHHARHPYHGR